MLEFAQPADGLGPAEGFLDRLAHSMALSVARVAGGAVVNGRPPVGVVLPHVRTDVRPAQPLDKVTGIVPLVGTYRSVPPIDSSTSVRTYDYTCPRQIDFFNNLLGLSLRAGVRKYPPTSTTANDTNIPTYTTT